MVGLLAGGYNARNSIFFRLEAKTYVRDAVMTFDSSYLFIKHLSWKPTGFRMSK